MVSVYIRLSASAGSEVPGVMAWLRLSRPTTKRQPARGNRHEHLGVLVAGDVTAHGEARHGDDRVADAADAVGEAIVVRRGSRRHRRPDGCGSPRRCRRRPSRTDRGPARRARCRCRAARSRSWRRGSLPPSPPSSTAPARAPSCIGKVASGTKRGSALAAASSPSFISLHQVSPWSGGSSLPNQSGQPPLTCLSMPCLSIQASRPETSLKPFMIGRLGLPPPKASDRPAGSSTIRSAGKPRPLLADGG